MSIVSDFRVLIDALALRVATEFKSVRASMGDRANLTTTQRSTLVAAINEVRSIANDAAGSGGAQSLTQLTDVNTAAENDNDILVFSGGQWVNRDGTDYYDEAGAAAAAEAASQPRDSDLTAIAALTTTPFGRALLTQADAATLTNLLGRASETVPGIVELATNAEAVSGSSSAHAVTPAGLQAFLTDFIGAAPENLNEWAEIVNAIEASDDDIESLLTALSNKQDKDATLTALAGVTTAANKLVYANGVDSFTTADLTVAGRAVIGAANAAAQRDALSVYSKDEIGTVTGFDPVATFEAGLLT